MDALGDTDGTTGSKGLPSVTDQVDQHKKDLRDQLAELHQAFTNKDFDVWLALWPTFEQDCKLFLETHITPPLPDFDFPSLEEGQDADADDTEEEELNLNHLPLPTGDDWFTADDVNAMMDEYAGTTESDAIPPPPVNELASPPPLADQALLPPPPVNEQALVLPPPPANKPASPPPPPRADQAFAKLTQADTLARNASILINEAAIDGSIELNKDSVNHLESCQTQVSEAKKSLQEASLHLVQARLVNQGESLSQLMKDG